MSTAAITAAERVVAECNTRLNEFLRREAMVSEAEMRSAKASAAVEYIRAVLSQALVPAKDYWPTPAGLALAEVAAAALKDELCQLQDVKTSPEEMGHAKAALERATDKLSVAEATFARTSAVLDAAASQASCDENTTAPAVVGTTTGAKSAIAGASEARDETPTTSAKSAIAGAEPIVAPDLDTGDAELAFHDASLAEHRALIAKNAAFALVLASREPAGSLRTYSLLVKGNAKVMVASCRVDVRATSEARAWAEMVRHSPRLALMIDDVRSHSITEWQTVWEAIQRDRGNTCLVCKVSAE